jgi:hypothetical protein
MLSPERATTDKRPEAPNRGSLIMLATIDFEASATNAYPIEVGVAIYRPGRAQISVWSSLIRPAPERLDTTQWDPVAADVH